MPKSNKEVKEIKKVKEEFRSLFVDSGTDLVIPERQTSDSRRVWKMKPIWSWIESTISQTRQEVIEEIKKELESRTHYYRSIFSRCCDRNETEEEKSTEMLTKDDVLKLLEDLNKKRN